MKIIYIFNVYLFKYIQDLLKHVILKSLNGDQTVCKTFIYNIFLGTQLGNALCFPIASFLCAHGFDGGWPSVFYVLGKIL